MPDDLEATLTKLTNTIQEAIYELPDKRARVHAIMLIGAQVFLDDAIDPEYRTQVGHELGAQIARP